MTVPLWLLIPGIPLALIGALVVAFAAVMLADEIRLARRRRPAPFRPTLTALSDPDDDDTTIDDESANGLVVDHRLNGRKRI